jgi:heat shock protein HtpX
VLRKVLSQQLEGVVPRQLGSMVQHMLLVANAEGKTGHWLDSHPPLAQRIRRIYGRDMGPLPLLREDEKAKQPRAV